MAPSEAGSVETAVARALAPLCVLSGAVVLSGFFFPDFVGEAVTGVAWLGIALVFFVSGLAYLAVLPHRSDTETRPADHYLLAVRRSSLRNVVREFLARQDLLTLGPPVAVFAIFFGLQLVYPSATSSAVDAAAGAILRFGKPVFLATVFLAVCYCLFLLLGPWGDVTLGDPDREPAYTYPTYFTLIFTAGIAAGLVFWGPAEALFHVETPPPYFGAPARSAGAVNDALVYSLFHWGVSAWSAYAVIGVPIAYFVFNRDAPLRVSTILAPFLGVDGLDSVWSRLLDTLAVFATIGGIATSLALVSTQFLAGIGSHWDVTVGALGPVIFVAGLTLIFVLSGVTGIHRGIRRIAGLTVALFALFALLLVAVGPRRFVVDQGVRALGRYVVHFVPLSLYLDGAWVADWTVWNWAWWFSWAPFAGLFVAALSRGRTIRTVVFTSVVTTAGATMGWFLLLGGTALSAQRSGAASVLAALSAGGGEAVAGFPVFASLPLGQLLVFLFLALIVAFMTTSADTSTLVVSLLATKRGAVPTSGTIVFWGLVQGAVATAVLLIGGAETLQALAVLTGGPFALVSLVALAGLTVTLARDESGHMSLLRRVVARLPSVQLHHDVEPPEKD